MTLLDHVKYRRHVAAITVSLFFFVAVTGIEGQVSTQERAATLRAQLTEVQAKQVSLQTELKYLEELLKPLNIEKSLAGVGSTRPEDLREARWRQLDLERRNVQAQLDLLAASQARLEASIIRADADAYNQSAIIIQEPNRQSSSTLQPRRTTRTRPRARRTRNRSRASLQ